VPRHGAPTDLILDGSASCPPPPALLGCLSTLKINDLASYPSTQKLTQALAAHWSWPVSGVLVTAGVDDAIDRLSRAILSDGREFLLPSPTFEMLTHYATMAGGQPKRIVWPVAESYPTQAVLEAITPETRMIVAISPNNPTGACIRKEDIGLLAEAAPHAILLLDLAYVEYAAEDPSLYALQWPNVVVTHTFSKAWGLPSLRVGYALGHPDVIEWMRVAGEPYAVATPSLHLAHAMFCDYKAHLAEHTAQVRREREALHALFTSYGMLCSPSEANFVFVRVGDAPWLRDALAGLGIAIRIFPESLELSAWTRITCPGDPTAFSRLTAALHTALSPQAILFDMDGVLVDVSGSYRRAILETAASFGAKITQEDIHAIKAEGDANNDWIVTKRLLSRAGIEADLAEVTARFEALYQGEGEKRGLREEESLRVDRAWLMKLKARYPLGIVTGRPRSDALYLLEREGLSDLFSALVCMEDAPRKPDPRPVALCLERLGVERAWLLGDTPDDIHAARRAGVLPIGIIAPLEETAHATATLTGAGAARVFTETLAFSSLLQEEQP
jgi:histidinol-phosphate aminotransferase